MSSRDDALIMQFLRAGFLPDELTMGVVRSDDWARHCVAVEADLNRRVTLVDGSQRREPVRKARVAFTKLVYQRFFRFPVTTLVSEEYGSTVLLRMCTRLFRTRGEELYGERLVPGLQDADQWRGNLQPCDAALRFRLPILRAEFRFLCRYDDEAFWGQKK